VSVRRVLVVDDDAAIRELLRATFPEVLEVVEARDGAEALELVEADRPDLVLLDWRMPGKSGRDVLAELKARHPDVPVIVLSAEPAARLRDESGGFGVDLVLTKPFSPLQLLGAVERLLPDVS
jgi:CheY-like chemotaxis protein